jgi:hypothetical protein
MVPLDLSISKEGWTPFKAVGANSLVEDILSQLL